MRVKSRSILGCVDDGGGGRRVGQDAIECGELGGDEPRCGSAHGNLPFNPAEFKR